MRQNANGQPRAAHLLSVKRGGKGGEELKKKRIKKEKCLAMRIKTKGCLKGIVKNVFSSVFWLQAKIGPGALMRVFHSPPVDINIQHTGLCGRTGMGFEGGWRKTLQKASILLNFSSKDGNISPLDAHFWSWEHKSQRSDELWLLVRDNFHPAGTSRVEWDPSAGSCCTQ